MSNAPKPTVASNVSKARISKSVIEHPPFRSRVRGSKKIFVSTGAWPEERDHLHLQTVPAAISDDSFRIS